MLKSVGSAVRTAMKAHNVSFAVLIVGMSQSIACVDGASPSEALGFPSDDSAPRTAAENATRFVAMAQCDPMALLRLGIRNYDRDIKNYRCVFLRQERLNGKLTPRQTIEVLYRESPRAILMTWVRNVGQARRALYRETVRADGQIRSQLLVEPAGFIARLVAKQVTVPVRGRRARRAGRYTIDQFGFRAVLERVLRDSGLAQERGDLDLTYTGQGEIDGRPTLILVRRLPYTSPKGPYSDARLVLHLDREWLVPLAAYSYADPEGKTLLGSYVMTSVKLNQEFDDAAFMLQRRPVPGDT